MFLLKAFIKQMYLRLNNVFIKKNKKTCACIEQMKLILQNVYYNIIVS